MTKDQRTSFRWFYVGALALAAVIGLLVGASSSPTVAVVVPLLFSLLTAGGAIYVVREDSARDSQGGGLTTARKAAFVGKQLLCFSGGFLLGLCLGVYVRVATPGIFSREAQSAPAAYLSLEYSDARWLSAAIALDTKMIRTGASLEERARILRELAAAYDGWGESREAVGSIGHLLDPEAAPDDWDPEPAIEAAGVDGDYE